jgi:hypothetical protein
MMKYSADGAPNNTPPGGQWGQQIATNPNTTLMKRIITVGTIEPQLTVVGKDYQDVKQIPLMRIRIFPGMLAVEDTQPLITADGAPVAATGAGTWGQLYAAGTPRRR